MLKFIAIILILTSVAVSAEHIPNEYEREVMRLTNQYRESQGVKPLSTSRCYCKGSREWSEHMYKNGFRHASNGFNGENIAKGQRTPKEVVRCWIRSEGHRKNILNPSFKKTGVGFYKKYWTQRFGR